MTIIDRFICCSPEETHRAGERLAPLLKRGDVLGLIGNLGAGKTLLVQGVARGLDVPSTTRVTSPTFSLINEYTGGRLDMVHVDLYRIESDREFEHIGLDELLDHAGVAAVEWCDRFDVLPIDHLSISIDIEGESTRAVTVTSSGPRSEELGTAWKESLGES